MPSSVVLIAIFAAVALGVLALSSLLAGERKAADRLRDLDKAPQLALDTRSKRKKSPLEMKRRKEELASKLLGPLSKVFSGSGQQEQLRERMLYAGLRSQATMGIFLGVKAALGAALPLTVLLALLAQHVPIQRTVIITGLVAILGLRLPNLWLSSRVRSRQQAIAKGLPDTLDLMVVCVESGLGLDAALNRISDELVSVYPEISEELLLVNLEMRAGASPSANANVAPGSDIGTPVSAHRSTAPVEGLRGEPARAVLAAGPQPSRFSKVRDVMPVLIAQMKEDLFLEGWRTVREFSVVRKGVLLKSSASRFVYYPEDHDDLYGKLTILENCGYVSEVTTGKTPIYRMTEEFVELVLAS